MPELGWDSHYQGDCAPWETGTPSSELQRVVAEDRIPAGRAIDLGCGSGYNAIWLEQHGFQVTGVDISQLAIEKAQKRAAAAGVSINFVLGDLLALPDGFGPYSFFFDRGCYHAVRRDDVKGYVQTLLRITQLGSIGLILAGNAKERHEPGMGPPVVSAEEMHAELEPAFEIIRLREFRFDSLVDGGHPLAWSCLLRRT